MNYMRISMHLLPVKIDTSHSDFPNDFGWYELINEHQKTTILYMKHNPTLSHEHPKVAGPLEKLSESEFFSDLSSQFMLISDDVCNFPQINLQPELYIYPSKITSQMSIYLHNWQRSFYIGTFLCSQDNWEIMPKELSVLLTHWGRGMHIYASVI